jgi:ATP-binding cassette subfamily B protein
MKRFIRNITGNSSGKFFKAVLASCLCDLANFGGFFFVILLLYLLLNPYLGGQPADTGELLLICGAGAVYMAFCYFAALPAYNACYVATYNNSAKGRLRLAEHIRRLSLGTLSGLNSAQVSQSMMKDFANLENANSHIIPGMFSSLLISLAVFAGLLLYSPALAVGFFSFVPLAFLALFLARVIGSRLSKNQMAASLEASQAISEYIAGIAVIKTNNMQGARFARLEDRMNRLRRESIRLEVILMPFAMTAMSSAGAGIGIMALYGQYQLVHQEISVMEFLMVLLIASRGIAPFIAFSLNFLMLQYFAQSGKSIAALMNKKPLSGESSSLPRGTDLVMKNVSFSYEKGKKVLDNVSLEIKAGTRVAVAGPSGSGKSTLVKLLARFHDPDEGRVLMGDAATEELTDISLPDPEILMSRYAMVFQDSYLFRGSVYDNVTLGQKNVPEETVREALRRAQADFAEPGDPVAEGGKNFSGGERQRICIARCLLKEAPIVILDEMTSSLDVYSEAAAQRAVMELTRGKTAVIIAHKLKSIMSADLIVVMDSGRIAGKGRHEELLQSCPLYRRLWEQGENDGKTA